MAMFKCSSRAEQNIEKLNLQVDMRWWGNWPSVLCSQRDLLLPNNIWHDLSWYSANSCWREMELLQVTAPATRLSPCITILLLVAGQINQSASSSLCKWWIVLLSIMGRNLLQRWTWWCFSAGLHFLSVVECIPWQRYRFHSLSLVDCSPCQSSACVPCQRMWLTELSAQTVLFPNNIIAQLCLWETSSSWSCTTDYVEAVVLWHGL